MSITIDLHLRPIHSFNRTCHGNLGEQLFKKDVMSDFLGKCPVSEVGPPLFHLFGVPQWICASVNIVFVRWKSLYFRQQVPSFLMRQCHIWEFTAPSIRDLYRGGGGGTMVERQMTPGSPVNQGKALSLPALPSFPNKEQNQLNHHHYYSSLSSASKSTPQLGKTSTAKKRFLSGIAQIT